MSQAAGQFYELVNGLHISSAELGIVTGVLGKHLAGRRVWAFGSRATGKRLKRFSDLDLAIEGKLTWEERSLLEADFDESPLPFKVDMVEMEKLESSFRERIESDFVEIRMKRH